MTNDPADKARLELERRLDEALRDTFPASDPISIQQHGIVGGPAQRAPDTTSPTRPKPVG
jgi:hypothetical protein